MAPERILTELLEMVFEGENMKNPEVKITPISTGGANYSSTLHLITVKRPGKQDLELFAKVSCIGERIRTEVECDFIFGNEMFVYRELSKIYDNLQRKNNIPDEEKFLFPKFYAGTEKYLEETVILENLIANGYELYDRLKSVTWEYASVAIGELAKFHALSCAFADDDPEAFAKAAAERKSMFSGSQSKVFDNYQKSKPNALEAVPEESRGRLKEYLGKESNYENFKRFYTFSRRPVFVHGDYRPSNLLHKMVNGKLERLIPVDYQTLHAGSPVADLFYFIFLSTDGKFRKSHYNQCINHYYTSFAQFLTKLGLNPEKLYPREDFNEDLKGHLPFGLMISYFLLPIILVETENAPNHGEDASIENFVVKPNDTFKERFCEIVEDFMEWGIL